jgi:Kef-type K+ transport system membrane component KefB/flavin reductase (DIM6/NTAB) family NADH-FMN oxidoreductase RutF
MTTTAERVVDTPAARPPRSLSLSRVSVVYGLLVLIPVGIVAFLLKLSTGSHAHASGQSNPLPALADPVGAVLLASVVVVSLCGLCGIACRAIGQSPVVGEMLAGVLLGPSAFGVLAPGLEHRIFPASTMALMNILAQVGVVFFMFLIGLEIPLNMLKRVGRAALPVGHAAVAVPFALGIALAVTLRGRYQPDGVRDLPFILFVALAVSVTAFPVLARILSDRELVGTRIGTMGLAVAGVGDVTAWCVLGVVIAEIRNGSSFGLIRTIVAVLAFTGVLWFGVRPALDSALKAAESRWQGTLPAGTLIAAFVLLCAVLTNWFGVHAIFGAFLAGIVMPRSSRSVTNFAEKTEGLTLWVMLPLFFATIGLQTRLQAVFSHSAMLPLLGVLTVAIVGKVAGAGVAALMVGEDRRSALGLGAMMNCRGLTELVVLNIGLSLHVIPRELFSVLVVMTLVTTMMTDPMLRALKIGSPAKRVTALEEDPIMRPADPLPDLPPVEAALLRNVCGHFATGVTVITAGSGDRADGTTVNSFTSVSLSPPLVLFCLHKDSRLRPVIDEFGTFVVNFLTRPQERIAWAFSGKQTAVMQDVPHRLSAGGLPILTDALAFLGCRVVNEMDGGDHSIYLGYVEELDVLQRTREPLIFFRGLMGSLADDPRGAHPLWDG